ncbi:hypothetical protein CK203_097377 [Vitis vinifera]|uniref:Uncharacterized protein n=1 Tax=Vitis vinifera TaxID=29760 RepID=A0A438EXN6_VITVI|nr:hypothetical protein CK203_097377 [Vitis vinifera]
MGNDSDTERILVEKLASMRTTCNDQPVSSEGTEFLFKNTTGKHQISFLFNNTSGQQLIMSEDLFEGPAKDQKHHASPKRSEHAPSMWKSIKNFLWVKFFVKINPRLSSFKDVNLESNMKPKMICLPLGNEEHFGTEDG